MEAWTYQPGDCEVQELKKNITILDFIAVLDATHLSRLGNLVIFRAKMKTFQSRSYRLFVFFGYFYYMYYNKVQRTLSKPSMWIISYLLTDINSYDFNI